jgi:hypothetical protein
MSERRQQLGVLGIGLIRVGAGAALGGRPASFLRWERGIPAGSSMDLLMRTVGIRDFALGLGTVASLRSGSRQEQRRWVGAGLLSDALDVGAGLAAARTTGGRGVLSALVALPVAVLDVWVLVQLRNAPDASIPSSVARIGH